MSLSTISWPATVKIVSVTSFDGWNWKSGPVDVPSAGCHRPFGKRRDPLRESIVGIKPSWPRGIYTRGRNLSGYIDLAILHCRVPKDRE